MSLQGKSAIVTGSTSGIGLAIARACAKDGANVMINGFGEADAIEHERAALTEYRAEDTPLRVGTDGRPSRIDMRRARWPD